MNIKNGTLKEALKSIINDNRTDILTNPDRLNAVLKDLCPKQSKEIDVIVSLCKNHMFEEIIAQSSDKCETTVWKALDHASSYYAASLVQQVSDVLVYAYDINPRDLNISSGSVSQLKQTVNTPQSKKRNLIVPVLIAAIAVIGCGIFAANHFHLFQNSPEDPEIVAAASKTEEAEEPETADDAPAEVSESEIDQSADPEESEVDFNTEIAVSEPIGYADVKISNIKMRSGPSSSAADTGKRTSAGDRFAVYAIETGDGYTWYRISEGNEWIADSNGEWVTFSESPAVDPTDAEYVADEWHRIYISFLEANNHGGDASYLIQYKPERIQIYMDRYRKYNAGYTFQNIYFDFDKTAFRITNLGSGKYEADCYAHVYNITTEISTGKIDDNDVLVHARLEYDPDQGLWLLALQEAAKNYSYSGHDMIRYE